MSEGDSAEDAKGVFAVMGRLIDAVRDAGGGIPFQLDPLPQKPPGGSRFAIARERRIDLSRAIDEAFAEERAQDALKSDAKAKNAFKALQEATELARRLSDLLTGDDLPEAFSLWPYYSRMDGASAWPAVYHALQALPSALAQEQDRLASLGLDRKALLNVPVADPENDPEGVRSRRDATAQHMLLRALGDVYREFFEAEPAVGRDRGDKGDTPFIAFIRAVRAMDGRPMEAGAAKRAWARATETARSEDKGPKK